MNDWTVEECKDWIKHYQNEIADLEEAIKEKELEINE